MSDDQNQDWPGPAEPEGSSSEPPATPPPPAPPPPPAGEPSRPPIPPASGVSGSPGTLGQRFLARLIDGILLAIVQFAIITPIIVAIAVSDDETIGFMMSGFSFGAILISIFSIALSLVYYGWFDSNRGQTLGKMAMKLKVVSPNGGNPTFEESVRRNAWLALSIIPFLGGLIQLGIVIWIAVTINSAPDGRGPHDDWAGGTQVVVA